MGPGIERLNPLGDRNVIFSKEVTLSGILDDHRMIMIKTEPWLKDWDFQPFLLSSGKGKGLEIELMIYPSYLVKPL